MTTSAERPRRPPAALLRQPACALALGFGAGLAPRAPGTFGALLGLPLAAALTQVSLPVAALVLALLSLVGVWCCDIAGRRLGVSDHSAIVWDEVVGMALTLLAVPLAWPHYLARIRAVSRLRHPEALAGRGAGPPGRRWPGRDAG